ncbi:MAG: DUF2959 domain-containing protein [Gammaproteobacteria bacterium]|jgi:hypothetical protein
MKLPITKNFCVLLVGAALLAACSSTYYRALESVGIEKRDLLVDRVDDARDAQSSAKDQFASALEAYRSVVEVDAGNLEKVYDRLDSEYQRSERRAEAVSERIDSVESVADDLFDEWQQELGEYSDVELRRRSEALLNATRAEYDALLAAMRKAEQSMTPVLALFKDQVLFLRHNLNARAIGSLRTELDRIERATTTLIADVDRAIVEADRFIQSMDEV